MNYLEALTHLRACEQPSVNVGERVGAIEQEITRLQQREEELVWEVERQKTASRHGWDRVLQLKEEITRLQQREEGLVAAYKSAHDRAAMLDAQLKERRASAARLAEKWHEEFTREYDIAPWRFDDD